MFEKLLSVLPYNPSLVHQLSFYGKRMRQEQVVRRAGLIMIILTFFVQFFAVISPPHATVASSNNDILNGGFSSKQEAVDACNSNRQNFRDIANFYGISCGNINNTEAISISSTSSNNQLFSIGRLSYGQNNPRTGKPTSETPINIANLTTVYARYLSSFDSRANSQYKVLSGISDAGKRFYIMFDCGNFVSVGVPTQYVPPAPTPPPAPPAPPVVPPTPQDLCPNIPGNQTSTTQCDVCPKVPGEQTNTSQCDVCPNIPGEQSNAGECDVCPKVPGNQSNTNECDVCPKVPGEQSTEAECKPCEKSVSSNDSLACIGVHKTGGNLTQNISDANNTTAAASDTIVYTLYALNSGKITVEDYLFQENISDVMDYADVIDLHGGTKDDSNLVTWPKVDIKAGETAMVQVTVRVKAEIPQTPTSTSDSAHYDMIMTNVYGNTVNIKLPPTPVKTVETVAAVLPTTGPGETMLFGAVVVMLASYFLARARLLANETSIAIQETTNGGL